MLNSLAKVSTHDIAARYTCTHRLVCNSELSPVEVSTAPLVVMRNISKSYAQLRANDAIDLTIQAGEIHALLGENGAGKSTLVKVLYGLLKPDTGSVL